MRTVGIDLAAEPAKTAVAILDWVDGTANVVSLRVGQTDDDITAAIDGAAKVGLDAPIGWPEPFIEFVNAHRNNAHPRGDVLPATDLAGRRLLAYRETDRAVTALTGLRPLSVSADRIGHAAMRAAGIIARLSAEGLPVDRDGSGLVAESYPAAALKQWGFAHSRYKRVDNAVARGRLVEELAKRLPGVRFGDNEGLCRESDDALDAVICALIARAAALGQVARPSGEQQRLAEVEGWIVVPTSPVEQLFSTAAK